MAMIPRRLGGFIEKAGVNIEGLAGQARTRLGGWKSGKDVDEIAEEVGEIGKDTGERINEINKRVEQKIADSNKIKEAYRSNKNGTDSAASEAINRTSEPKAGNSKANQIRFTNQDGAVVERNINTDYNPNSPKGESNNRYNYVIDGQEASLGEFKNMAAAHVQSGGTFDTLSEQAAQVAEQTSKTSVLERSGIPDMMMNHPFASAGIAGGAGILGASLFGGGSDDDGYN